MRNTRTTSLIKVITCAAAASCAFAATLAAQSRFVPLDVEPEQTAPAPKVVALTDATLDAAIKNGLVFVDFTAPAAPEHNALLEELAARFGAKVTIAKIDLAANRKAITKHQIKNVPTFILYKDGQAILTTVGLRTTNFFAEAIQSELPQSSPPASQPQNESVPTVERTPEPAIVETQTARPPQPQPEPYAPAAATPAAATYSEPTHGARITSTPPHPREETKKEESGSHFFFYFSGGTMLLRATNSPGEHGWENFHNRNLGGGTIGIGSISGHNHYFGLDVGVFSGSVSGNEYTSKLMAVPIHLTYNYFLHFDDARRFRLRVGPTLGLTVFQNEDSGYSQSYSWPYTTYYHTVSKRRASFSGGGEIGFSAHLSKSVFLDIGYRLTATSTDIVNKSLYDGSEWCLGSKVNFLSHQLQASLGFRF